MIRFIIIYILIIIFFCLYIIYFNNKLIQPFTDQNNINGTIYASKLIVPNFKAKQLINISNSANVRFVNSITPFTVGEGTKILFISYSFYSTIQGQLFNTFVFTNTTSSTPFTLTHQIPMNDTGTHRYFSYNMVINNANLPAGEYNFTVNFGANVIFHTDYLYATLIELPTSDTT